MLSNMIVLAQGISIDLGKAVDGRYMKLVGNTGDGAITQNLKIGGEYCVKNTGTSMYFDIANDFFSQLAAGSYVIVNVEYYDTLNVTINLVYDAIGARTGKTHADNIITAGTGKWKSVAFFIDDAYFDNGLTNAADLKLVANGTMIINGVNVVPFEKYINYGDGASAGGVNDSDDVQGLTHNSYQSGDGLSKYALVGGQMCITNDGGKAYHYIGVDDAYIFQGNHPWVFVSVEYYDPSPTDVPAFNPTRGFRLQYNAPGVNNKSTQYVYQKGWGCFRTYTFEISDAYFGNLSNAASDMRINVNGQGIYINRVTVAILPKKPLRTTVTIPGFTAYKSLEPPTLDGNVSEWGWQNPYTLQPLFATDGSRTDEFDRTWLLNSANVPVVEPGEPGGVVDPGVPGLWDTKDLMGWYRMQWDDTNLYFSVVVKDNVADVTGANWSEKDGFGFFIDVSHAYTGTAPLQTPIAIRDDNSFQQGEHFIFFPATMSELAVWRHSANQAGEVVTTGSSGIQKSVVATDSGYTIEASIPLSLLKDGLTWNPGVLGDKDNFSPLFAYMLNDADRVGASSGRLMFGGYSEDDEFWGTLSMQPIALVDKGIMVDLGPTNYQSLMTQVGTTSGDGVVAQVFKMGKNSVQLSNLHAYFDVQDNVLSDAKPHRNLLLSVEYLDSAAVAGEQFTIDYTSTTAASQSYPTFVPVGSTNTWKTAIFEIHDAKFSNGLSNGADFRIRCTQNSLVMNQVRVAIADLWHNLGDSTAYGIANNYPADGTRGGAAGSPVIGGLICQTNTGTGGYFYFLLADTILNGNKPATAHSEVLISMEYYDTTTTSSLGLHYDGLVANNQDAPGNAYILGDRQWKLHSFYIPDGFFNNRLNSSDFRINLMGGKAFIRRVFLGAVDAGLSPTTGVYDESTVPHVFDLAPNYPNPFNPSTTLNYSLASEGLAALKVYNLLGQHVATLVNDVKHAGSYSTQWDASAFPSGVYLYRLTQNDNMKVRRLVLVK
jgi:hypothetical protein